MNKILIITTIGCSACDIAKKHVLKAKEESKLSIDIQIEDSRVIGKDFLKQHNIEDFPTVIYIKDDIIVNKAVGSYPFPVYLRWINMYFEN